jgi:hypothetical protein
MENYFDHWHAAGCSTVPIKLDGSKATPIRWKDFQSRLPTSEERSAWFQNRYGVAVVCGAISGGLEILDFDDPAPFPAWYASVHEIADRLPVIETAGGGYHVLYRCEEFCSGRKIATDPSREKQTLIESRGEGNYFISLGSPLAVHKSGQPYVQVSGPLAPDQIPMITVGERRKLWAAAERFNRGSKPVVDPKPVVHRRNAGESMFDRFDRLGLMVELLRDDGWVESEGGWNRPGQTAELRQGDVEVFSFCSTDGIFANYCEFTASQYLAVMRFGGDWDQAEEFVRSVV